MIELENCAYRIMRLLGVHHPKTVELATPDIVKELEHLTQAENATLKAHNRQLVEALEKISKMGAVCQEFEICEHPPCNDSAGAVLESLHGLQTPPAKLAQAEAEVLRAAEAWFSHNNDPDSLTILSFQERLEQAIEEMQEAKRGGY